MSINVLNALKPIGLGGSLADSRGARFYYSLANHYGYSSYTEFTVANSRAGHRIKMIYDGGLSGDRSDQAMARLQALIQSGAGTCIWHLGVNDINFAATGYTTQVNTFPAWWPAAPNQGVVVGLANVAQVLFQNLKYAYQMFMRCGGQRFLVINEAGGEVFGTGQQAANIDFNQWTRELAESSPGMIVFDDWTLMHDPTASTATVQRFKPGYAAEAVGSGTHKSNLGSAKGGIKLQPLIEANWPAISFLPGDVNEATGVYTAAGVTPNRLLLNPLFTVTSGGTGSGSNGVTGPIPGSWTVDRTGGGSTQTCVVSTGVPADGSPGNECIMTCTFGGAGDICRIRQDAVIANINIGDIIEGVGAILVDAGGASLAGVQMDLQYSDGSTTYSIRDMSPLDNNTMGSDGGLFYWRPPPFQIAAKAGGAFLSMRIYNIGCAAGGHVGRVRQVQIYKRSTL